MHAKPWELNKNMQSHLFTAVLYKKKSDSKKKSYPPLYLMNSSISPCVYYKEQKFKD